MKITAIVLNIALFLFTCMVLVTDGPPQEASYIVFAVWSQLTLILTPVAISLLWPGSGWIRNVRTKDLMLFAAIILNIVNLGFVCWALVDQYPHPDEEGFIEYAVLLVLVPIVSLVVLYRGRPVGGLLDIFLKRKMV